MSTDKNHDHRGLRVVSYNLKYASEDDPHRWSERRTAMVDLLSGLAPDVLGTQEGLAGQLSELSDGLGPAYDWVGEGRRGGREDEFCAVFYRTERLEVREVTHRSLSDTPSVLGSRSWGNELPRMVTDVGFTDRQTGRPFRVLNTHLDHVSQPAQRRSAELLRELIGAYGEPVLLLGDFNVAAGGSEPYAVLRGTPLNDAYLVAEHADAASGTFGDWGRPDPEGPRIDWILLSPQLIVRHAGAVDRTVDGHYPSDHLPVAADVELPVS